MSAGQVIGVVGPSGAGKDSVMAGIVARDPAWRVARRVITRAPGLGGEDYEAVDQAAFARLVAADAFCLHWTAHGLSYGIPDQLRARAQAGETLLVNLSRGVLDRAQAVFAGFAVLRLSARPETLAARLAGRGRETHEEIRARLAQPDAPMPSGLTVMDITNDGPLEDTVRAALLALRGLAANAKKADGVS